MIILFLSFAQASDHKIDPVTLPEPVVGALLARVPGAVIVGAQEENTTKGKCYEADVTLGDRKMGLAFLADGTWLEEEEKLPISALPTVLQSTLNSQWKGWTIEAVEKAMTPMGTSFNVKIEKGEKNREVVLTESGVVQRVEKGEREDEDEDEDEDNGHQRRGER